MKDWATIRQLVGEGVPQRQVARDLGISRETVRSALASDRPPAYERRQGPTSFDVFEPRVRLLLEQFPTLPASVIAERLGWTGSPSWWRQNVARVRPDYRRVDPADRLAWEPGDVIQCDLWFPPYKVPLEDGTRVLLPVLVMVAAFSRFTMALMLPSRKTEDLLLGMWTLLKRLGAVSHRLLWDNEAGIGRGKPIEAAAMFAGALATRIVLCKPYDPETKGIVERRNQFLETSFMPGRVFASPADFNQQLVDWLVLVNGKTSRATGAAPFDLLETDKARMLALPPAVVPLGWRNRVRLGRDYYVSIAGNDYSVDPRAIGRVVDVSATLERVKIRLNGQVVADHERVWVTNQTITDPAHVVAAKTLRAAFGQPQPHDDGDDLHRDLADYDLVFGLEAQVM